MDLSADVELGNLCPVPVAGIGQGKDGAFIGNAEIAVGKGGITQAIAEGELNGNTGAFKVAVAHIQALPVLHAPFLRREIGGAGFILIVIGIALRQFAAGVYRAHDGFQHGRRTGLAAEIAMDHGLAVLDPRHFHRRTSGQYGHHIGIDLAHRVEQVDLTLRQAHMGPIQALGLRNLVQADVQ